MGWQPPWTGEGTGFFHNHVFFQQLKGIAHNWERLRGAPALTHELAEPILAWGFPTGGENFFAKKC